MSIGDDGVPLKLSRRLTLVIHSLAQGGAERDMAHLARCWTERGHDVAVVTLDSVAADSYPLAEGVTRIGLGCRPAPTTVNGSGLCTTSCGNDRPRQSSASSTA